MYASYVDEDRSLSFTVSQISLAVQESEEKLQPTKDPDDSGHDIEGQGNAQAS